MNASPRIPPRFLPTLTEIVPAPPPTRAVASGDATVPTEAPSEPARGLDPVIERQVRELVIALVTEQLDSLQAAWRGQSRESGDK